ncbi:MAG TPA: PAS domain-containing protein [Candidatus Caenarcaniphilales bacterium]|nr:PAS domain-containing protein [Candidatus Caenarcaniphilales bacterium]
MSDATILLEPDGRYLDASPAALALIGVTIDELRSMPPGTLSPRYADEAEREALRGAFLKSGATRAVGSATISRPDGGKVRVKFLLERRPDGRYLAWLKPADESVDRPTVFITIGEALAAWRAAERRLETLEPNSLEWESVQADIQLFRSEYRRLSDRGRAKRN